VLRRCAAILFPLVVLASSSAVAAVPGGTLVQQSECFATTAADGCFAEGFLTGANAVAVTPDGKLAFVADYDTSTIAAYVRSADGTLTFHQCIAGSATTGCTTAPLISQPRDVLVAPDGKWVYVVSQGAAMIAAFHIEIDGSLSYATGISACVSANGANANGVAGTCVEDAHLSSPTYAAISPDGANVYVASYGNDSVEAYARNAATGGLTPLPNAAGCVSPTLSGCGAAPSLGGPIDADVSPDGSNVYVTGDNSDTLHVFNRGTDGSLSFASCYGAGASCSSGRGLTHPFGVVVSPDGRTVYTASKGSSEADGVVARFDRSTASATLGRLDQPAGAAGCVAEAGQPNPGQCATGHGLAGAQRLAVAPDGRSVYVTAQGANAVAVLDRDAAGDITERSGAAGCVSDTGADGCTDGKALGGAVAVAVGPEGRQVLVAGSAGDIALFGRSLDTDAPQTTITKGPSGKTKDRTPRFRFRSDDPAATFRCSVDHHRFRACASPHTLKRLSTGTHKFRVEATDSWGNTDSTPAHRKFKVVKR
jgi:DNA-binding beta-propeller fold protein YncE